MKRFWSEATAEPEDAASWPATWSVRLDGKPMRLPGGRHLRIATRPLAEALAAEWAAVGERMDWADVPLTRLAGTAQERVGPASGAVAAEIARYGESDLLCYRATEPPELVAAEAAAWDRWVDWAARTHGARLRVAHGIVHVAQSATAVAALAGAVGRCDVATLAGLGVIVPALGSLVLGLAVAVDAITPADAHVASLVDELFQAALWGEDEEAAARRLATAADVADAARFIALARLA